MVLTSIKSHEDDCGGCKCTNIENGIKVDCSNNRHCEIESVPTLSSGMYENIIVLDLTSCYRLSLNKTSFLKYSNLKVLVLYNCSLEQRKIDNETFWPLTNLQYLNISRNELFPLTDKTSIMYFENMNYLRVLVAYGTTGTYRQKETYAGHIYAKLTNLTELWIDGFNNSTFGIEFQNMTNLEVLRISGDMIDPPWRSMEFCNMKNINESALENLVHIKKLYIRKCGVTGIHKYAFSNLKKLEEIDLSSNSKLTIAKAFEAVQNLSKTVKTLTLDRIEDTSHLTCGVKLKRGMAEKMTNLSIQTLSLKHNAINSIENEVFASMPDTLENVYLQENEFEMGMYMFYIAQTRNLKFVDASYNFFGDAYMIWRETAGKNTKQIEKHVYDVEHYTPPNVVESYGNLMHHESIKTCPNTSFYIPPGTITIYLPPKLETIHLNTCKLGFPIMELFFDRNNSLRKISASNSLLYCWGGPIHGVERLEEIDLSYNGCSYAEKDFFTGFLDLKILNLKMNLLDQVIRNDENGLLFRNNSKLEHLDLSFNHIQSVPKMFLQKQTRLKFLDLSDNGLRKFELKLKHMTFLQELVLRNNHIVELDMDMLEELKNSRQNNGTLKFDIRGNLIECSCSRLESLRWIYDYMNGSKVVDVMIDSCYLNSDENRTIQTRSDLKQIILELEKDCGSYTTLIVLLVIVLVVIHNVIVAVIVHRFRWKIRYWYYVARASRRSSPRGGYMPLESHYKYHVYVASVSDDITFVMESLKPKLDIKNYKTFLQEDDILPGQNMYSIIANAIHVSQVVLFVISKQCEEDPYWHIAYHFAKEEAGRRGEIMFLGIFLDNGSKWSVNIEEIRRASFVEFPRGRPTGQEQTAFWDEFIERIDNKLQCRINT